VTTPTTATAAPTSDNLDDQAAALLAHLLEPVEVVDPTPITMALIRERIPAKLYLEFRASLLAVTESATTGDLATRILADELADVRAALVGPGFILHTPERRDLITTFGESLRWSANLVAALRGLSVSTVPRWRNEGRTTAPTLDTLRAELLAERTAADALRRFADISATRQTFDQVAFDLRTSIESGTLQCADVAAAFLESWNLRCQP
jgi:hypothetical protein